ncbi:unnamed protein product [Rotaria magnacalcarata]|uniref:Craniofacial development protein 2-like n=1 Tax=Rotaria magnacalcarata TaxID=392030 RepID=A0A816RKT8_9BILA|nr:unnamed protein product [Rotaria magnacalcarata]
MAWKDSGSQWEAVSPRIVTARIECRPVRITIIAVYAPIDRSNGLKNDIETCDEFDKTLQATTDKTHKSDMIMLMGDFNARVGVEQTNTTGGTVGNHSIDKQNQNGRQLVDFCLFNSFIITNTFFPHKAVHQGTWSHSTTKQWHMLDYILVNRKFRSSVQDVRAHRGATDGIGTYHRLLRAKIRQHEYWEELSIDIENAVKVHDPTTAFQIIRRLRGNGQSINHIPVQDKNGLTLTNSKDQLNRWKEYFDEMLNVDTTINEQVLQQIPSPTVDDEELSRQDAVPTIDEVVKTIGQIKNKKVPGKDDVPTELLKADGHYIAEWLHKIIRDV